MKSFYFSGNLYNFRVHGTQALAWLRLLSSLRESLLWADPFLTLLIPNLHFFQFHEYHGFPGLWAFVQVLFHGGIWHCYCSKSTNQSFGLNVSPSWGQKTMELKELGCFRVHWEGGCATWERKAWLFFWSWTAMDSPTTTLHKDSLPLTECTRPHQTTGNWLGM